MHLSLRPTRRLAALIALTVCLGALAGCGSGDDAASNEATETGTDAATDVTTGTESGATNQVTVVGFAFEPSAIVVAAGTTVVWTNEDETTHIVTPTSGEATAFGGSLDGAGSTVESTFDEPGTFDYFCSIHTSMTGVVTVEA